MAIEYIQVASLWTKYHLQAQEFNALSRHIKDFKLMRAQLTAQFEANERCGAFIVAANQKIHDQKCKAILSLAKSVNSDLVLFPEYCISYDVIKEIVQKRQLWPGHGELWCLPCQGIPLDKFSNYMEGFKNQKNAIVIDDGYTQDGCMRLVNPRKFINALIYCFIAVDENAKSGEDTTRIIIMPQLKTHPMRDVGYQCEEHMCTNNKIFLFGANNGNRMVSLICADSMNAEINWAGLSEHGDHVLILHPQLNGNCKNEDFQRIRREIFRSDDKQIYISCNWADGSAITITGSTKPTIAITNPWSCIYYNHPIEYSLSTWLRQKSRIESNADKLLYGGFMEKKKASVWYGATEEVLHHILIQKTRFNNPAVMASPEYVVVDNAFKWASNDWIQLGCDAERGYRHSHYLKFFKDEYALYFNELIADDAYSFPYKSDSKSDSDRFMELILSKQTNEFYVIDTDENTVSPALIMDKDGLKRAQLALLDIFSLYRYLRDGMLPPHLEGFKSNHRFALNKDEVFVSNLETLDKKQRMIVAIAQDKAGADMFIKHLERGPLIQYSRDGNMLPYKLCVFVRKPVSSEYEYYPKLKVAYTCPDRFDSATDISKDGGDN